MTVLNLIGFIFARGHLDITSYFTHNSYTEVSKGSRLFALTEQIRAFSMSLNLIRWKKISRLVSPEQERSLSRLFRLPNNARHSPSWIGAFTSVPSKGSFYPRCIALYLVQFSVSYPYWARTNLLVHFHLVIRTMSLALFIEPRAERYANNLRK